MISQLSTLVTTLRRVPPFSLVTKSFGNLLYVAVWWSDIRSKREVFRCFKCTSCKQSFIMWFVSDSMGPSISHEFSDLCYGSDVFMTIRAKSSLSSINFCFISYHYILASVFFNSLQMDKSCENFQCSIDMVRVDHRIYLKPWHGRYWNINICWVKKKKFFFFFYWNLLRTYLCLSLIVHL